MKEKKSRLKCTIICAYGDTTHGVSGGRSIRNQLSKKEESRGGGPNGERAPYRGTRLEIEGVIVSLIKEGWQLMKKTMEKISRTRKRKRTGGWGERMSLKGEEIRRRALVNAKTNGGRRQRGE